MLKFVEFNILQIEYFMDIQTLHSRKQKCVY